MFESINEVVRDRCLGELLPTGGSIRQVICPVSLPSLDSLDTLYEPAVATDGRLLYLREASQPNGITPHTSALVLAERADPLAATTVLSYPYTAPNGKIHSGISNIRWLSETRALFLAEKVMYIAQCSSCPIDTVRTGIELVEIDLSGPSATTAIIPNTEETSSVAGGAGPDQVYLTRNGDSRVYQMDLTTGTTIIVHDFGPGQIARDAQVTGNRLYAIVGGRVSFEVDSTLGSVQRDEGGQLVTVDLSNGSTSPLIVLERFFRRPAVSPTGDRMAAEAMQAVILGCGSTCRDTVISKVADLWLFDIP